ncbi:uncharacterized protein LOC123587957 [Leopardus geoffroyi]|uniref:uncharacterized protein LOC123587957 n=1 Tax=Leopardus geoffroyi TaxID=46844 RepID=UPI001E2620E3|nr:uncharacterized protein LOC123587957 [Leopardus geoffroyi]
MRHPDGAGRAVARGLLQRLAGRGPWGPPGSDAIPGSPSADLALALCPGRSTSPEISARSRGHFRASGPSCAVRSRQTAGTGTGRLPGPVSSVGQKIRALRLTWVEQGETQLPLIHRTLTAGPLPAGSRGTHTVTRGNSPWHHCGSTRPAIFKGTRLRPSLGLSQASSCTVRGVDGTPSQHAQCVSAPQQTPTPLPPCWAGSVWSLHGWMNPRGHCIHGPGHGLRAIWARHLQGPRTCSMVQKGDASPSSRRPLALRGGARPGQRPACPSVKKVMG